MLLLFAWKRSPGRVIVDEKLIGWRAEKDGQVTRVNPPAIILSQPPAEPESE